MQLTTLLTTLLTSASLVAAAPAAAPAGTGENNLGGAAGPLGGMTAGNPLTAGGQDATAEFFKLGDAVLNGPGDAATSGNPLSMLGSFGKTAMSMFGDVGKTAKNMSGR